MQFINAKSFCFSFDIHSAYHHIDIYEPHTTKVTRPLITKWRGEGNNILMYLDDGLGSYPDEDVCTAMAAQVKQDLILSGFV